MSKRKAIEFQNPSTSVIFGGRTRRPVDKQIITISKEGVTGTGFTTTLFTATFPCTIQGLRIDLNVVQDAGTSPGGYTWVIIILRDGMTQGTVATGDASVLYAPEQDVLMFGKGKGRSNAVGMNNQYRQLSTKTMRKFMGGDKLVFIGFGETTNTSAFGGAVQFFCKT